MIREQQQIRFPVAQWGNENSKYVQTVIQILPESFFRHRLFEVPVGSGNNPHVRSNRTGAAKPIKFLLLDYPEQLHLGRHIHFPDLVEKECAALSQFETAFLQGPRIRERSLFIPE